MDFARYMKMNSLTEAIELIRELHEGTYLSSECCYNLLSELYMFTYLTAQQSMNLKIYRNGLGKSSSFIFDNICSHYLC